MSLKRLLALTSLTAAAAFAQNGTITISGAIPSAVSMTDSSGNAVSSTQSIGSLTAANSTTLASITPVDIYVRSNQQFKMSASATITQTGMGAVAGGESIADIDIGFGITARDVSGGLVATGYTDSIVGKFNYITNSFGSLTVTNGLTPFIAGTHGTLHDIATSTQILQGSRVSQKGNILTNSNAVKYTFGAATLPQYFTPATSFQAVITLTVATF